MKRVFLLRAYGDFVIALQSLLKSPIRNEFEIIASRHHLPLYESLKDTINCDDLTIRFEEWHIHRSQLRLFTNRHLIHGDTLKELFLLRKFLQKESGNNGFDFLDQNRRRKLLQLFTGKQFTPIVKQGMIYDSFHDFFKTEKQQIPTQIGQQASVLILPSARIKKRDLPETLVDSIQKKHVEKNDQVSIAYFKNAKRKEAVSYLSFPELVKLISEADFVYGADSLPIHLCYLLQKPHFILYPKNGSNLFFTPYALENQFFSTFDSFK